LGYLKRLKDFISTKQSTATYFVWVFRVLLLTSVIYLIFFNQEKVVTEFNTTGADNTKVLDYKIEQNRVADSAIKQMKNEKINLDSLSNDSLKGIILRANSFK
jgi:hypothetical protein